MAACRLPIASGDAPQDGNPTHGTVGNGGFIQFPAGTFTPDPQSSGTYDLAVHRWLPVRHDWVSPDGTRYAWPEYRRVDGPATGIIHVVDVASGADHPITVPAPSMPVSWEATGLYITRIVPNSDAPPQGLSLLDPNTGALRQISNTGEWDAIGTGKAFGVDLDQSAPLPPQGGLGAQNRLRALDLTSGAISNLQTFPSTRVNVSGVQGANPVVTLQASDRVTIQAGSAVLYDQPAAQPAPAGPAMADGTTLWFSGSNTIWKSVAGGQLTKLSAPLQYSIVAGACR